VEDYLSQLLNVRNVSGVRQIELHTTEPLLPGPSHLEVQISIATLKKHKSLDIDQIPAELYQVGGETVFVIHELITSIWNKKELPDQWKESIIVSVHKTSDKTDVIIIMGYHCYQLPTKCYQMSFFYG
jgi:hypothetical protein